MISGNQIGSDNLHILPGIKELSNPGGSWRILIYAGIDDPTK